MKIWNMTKVSLKILLRKKGFLFFLVFIPIFSLELLNLNLNMKTSAHSEEYKETIAEMESSREQIVYSRDYSRMPVVVFDAEESQVTDMLLKSLVRTGIFQIYRIDASDLSETAFKNDMQWHMDKNNVKAFLYLKKNFTEAVLNGMAADGVCIYQTNVDEREKLFCSSLDNRLESFETFGEFAEKNPQKLTELLEKSEENMPEKTVRLTGTSVSGTLSEKQKAHLDTIGYSVVILTLGYVFLGVFISSVTIVERKHKVYSRICMTNVSQMEYILAKFLVSLMTVIIQTLIIGVGMILLVRADFGIGQMEYMILVFFMGLIFCNMTMCIGMMGNNLMNANYIAFTIWCITCTMSGLCFPLDNTSVIIQKASDIMPQKWVINASKMLMQQNHMAFITMIAVTAAYLMMIASVGLIGMRLVQDE